MFEGLLHARHSLGFMMQEKTGLRKTSVVLTEEVNNKQITRRISICRDGCDGGDKEEETQREVRRAAVLTEAVR